MNLIHACMYVCICADEERNLRILLEHFEGQGTDPCHPETGLGHQVEYILTTRKRTLSQTRLRRPEIKETRD